MSIRKADFFFSSTTDIVRTAWREGWDFFHNTQVAHDMPLYESYCEYHLAPAMNVLNNTYSKNSAFKALDLTKQEREIFAATMLLGMAVVHMPHEQQEMLFGRALPALVQEIQSIESRDEWPHLNLSPMAQKFMKLEEAMDKADTIRGWLSQRHKKDSAVVFGNKLPPHLQAIMDGSRRPLSMN